MEWEKDRWEVGFTKWVEGTTKGAKSTKGTL